MSHARKTKDGFVEKQVLKATTVHQELRVLRRMLNVAVRKKFLFANPCAGIEFPARVDGLFRPHYVTWSEQQKIEFAAPEYPRNVIRIVTETGLRIYKELTPMKKDQLDLVNRTVWIPDSKTPNGVAEVPLTDIAVDAFRNQFAISGPGPYLFPSDENASGHQKTLKTAWHAALRRAKVFKKYSQMKLQMKREALAKLNRQANETGPGFGTAQGPAQPGFGTVWHSKGTAKAMGRQSINSFGISRGFGRGGAI
jgi:integrase